MNSHFDSLSAVEKQLQTDLISGLSQEECLRRQEKYGKNKLVEAKKETILQRFLKQLADPMIIILLVAAAFGAAGEHAKHKCEGKEQCEFAFHVFFLLSLFISSGIKSV